MLELLTLALIVIADVAYSRNLLDKSDDARLSTATQPILDGLLARMLRPSRHESEVRTRPIVANFSLVNADINYFANLTNMTHFRKLLKPILVPRIVGTEGHRRVEETLRRLGFHVEIDAFVDKTPIGPKRFRNIIATYDTEVKTRLLLACHYDSKILKGKVFIGAIDSAVPCALILDVAETLAPLLERSGRAPTTLQLVFFDGEEAFENWTNSDSLYGSRHLAKLWDDKGEVDKISAFVLLDLLGTRHSIVVHQFGHGTKHLFSKLVEIEDYLNRTGTLQKAEKTFHSFEIAGPIGDDHLPFQARRVPIMHLISFLFPDTWHTIKDDELSLDMPTISNLASVLRAFVAGYLGLRP